MSVLKHSTVQNYVQRSYLERAAIINEGFYRKHKKPTGYVSVQENVFVEFNHQELLEFYNKLEIVQGQLDSLT
ncbi:unnamed protein product [Pleuronectes platessa]|uniref:Uncharacterized protein n=1 Tax=Pleuronectes platessa TaxID=8262 RepID=A0A9N7U035_PLEPL|nr:unnamed protein product [Pleuronectes platessa]